MFAYALLLLKIAAKVQKIFDIHHISPQKNLSIVLSTDN